MKLALYVHDLKLEIGHSNSLIELIRHLPEVLSDKVEEVEVVSFTTAPVEDLFPNIRGKKRWIRVPFKGMRPVFVKAIFYHLWTFFYNRLFQGKGFLRIGIGISSLDVDAVSVQFIHHQWTERGLAMEQGHFVRKIYKRILFAYFEVCERFLFRRPGLKVFSPAQFLTDFLKGLNPRLKAETVYSGVNLERFRLEESGKEALLGDLVQRYPVLSGLDLKRPVYLFVGAYERKGLPEALNLLRKVKDPKPPQFIVIGSPSLGRQVTWPSEVKVFPIGFTREVPKFYALADAFVFPTMYEPFGLVLFEAMAMGLSVITRREEVGASELLEGLPEVYFCDRPGFQFPEVGVKGVEERLGLRNERLQRLGDVSWIKAGKELAHFLSGQ